MVAAGGLRHLYTLTVFSSAFLLFMIQPMLAKMLLPKVGGAPSVWIVSMLFFQLMLLAGYAYAAFGNATLRPTTQAIIHVVLLITAIICFLPLSVPSSFNLAEHAPEWLVLGALLISVGLPYFALAAHNSLLQHWYYHRFGVPPYPLFAVSNAGSFAGLLGYPLMVEWLWPLSEQTLLWSAGFCLLACMVLSLAVAIPRGASKAPAATSSITSRTIGWVVLLGFIPSSLFLSTTLYLTSDIASFPLLWVAPLALYLLSFIIAFSPALKRMIELSHILHPLAVVCIVLSINLPESLSLLLSFVTFFIIAISCHGALARLKPEPEKLGTYYLWLSFGGTLGGLLGVVAPHLFNNVYEHFGVAMLSLAAVYSTARMAPRLWVMLLVLLIVTMGYHFWGGSKATILHQSRNFFGISRVIQNDTLHRFSHGTTNHGIQSRDPARKHEITSYYGPIQLLLKDAPASIYRKPFAVLGLGAGTLACTGKANQQLDFFEIDRDVIAIARNPKYFTYLRDCPPSVSVILGDGRLTLAEKEDARYNLLVIDAFSSDAIPVHLLTTEAMQLYVSKLAPKNAILAVHISNRHLHLEHLTAAAIRTAGWTPFLLKFTPADKDPLIYPSLWMFAVPPGSAYQPALIALGASPYTADATAPWTDDYSNILDALLP